MNQPAPKASKAAGSDGTTVRTSGTAAKRLTLTDYRIKKSTAAATAASTAETQIDFRPSDATTLSDLLTDDTVMLGGLDSEEYDNWGIEHEAHEKIPRPDGRHARERLLQVARGLIVGFGMMVVSPIAATHAHSMNLRLGGESSPLSPSMHPPQPP